MAENNEMATTRLPKHLHRWLKLEAVHRESTIETELAKAVELLQSQRTAGNGTQAQPQPVRA
jgi:hypothetical protein